MGNHVCFVCASPPFKGQIVFLHHDLWGYICIYIYLVFFFLFNWFCSLFIFSSIQTYILHVISTLLNSHIMKNLSLSFSIFTALFFLFGNLIHHPNNTYKTNPT